MKENIEEDIIKKFENPQYVDLITLIRQFKKEGLESFIVLRKNNFDKILSDYKKLQEEFRQVDHECERLEQKELRLEKEIGEWQRAYREEKDAQFELLRENQLAKEALKKQCDITDERNQLLREKQKLQKENEELNKIKSLIEILKVNAMEDEKYIVITKGSFFDGSFKFLLDDYLPKQKIKDKIEFIEKEGYWLFLTDRDSDKCVEILQDLLEER